MLWRYFDSPGFSSLSTSRTGIDIVITKKFGLLPVHLSCADFTIVECVRIVVPDFFNVFGQQLVHHPPGSLCTERTLKH